MSQCNAPFPTPRSSPARQLAPPSTDPRTVLAHSEPTALVALANNTLTLDRLHSRVANHRLFARQQRLRLREDLARICDRAYRLRLVTARDDFVLRHGRNVVSPGKGVQRQLLKQDEVRFTRLAAEGLERHRNLLRYLRAGSNELDGERVRMARGTGGGKQVDPFRGLRVMGSDGVEGVVEVFVPPELGLMDEVTRLLRGTTLQFCDQEEEEKFARRELAIAGGDGAAQGQAPDRGSQDVRGAGWSGQSVGAQGVSPAPGSGPTPAPSSRMPSQAPPDVAGMSVAAAVPRQGAIAPVAANEVSAMDVDLDLYGDVDDGQELGELYILD